MNLNPLDWLLVTLLAYSAFRAGMNGFFREAFSLAGFVLGFPLACWYYHDAGRALAGLITTPAFAQFAGFLLILAAATVLASLLGRVFRKGARTVGLGWADRLGGAVFGLLRGALVAGAFLLAITAFLPAAPWVRTSLLAPYLLRGAHAVSFTMPADLRLQFGEALGRLGIAHHSGKGSDLKHSTSDWIKSGLSSHTGMTSQVEVRVRE